MLRRGSALWTNSIKLTINQTATTAALVEDRAGAAAAGEAFLPRAHLHEEEQAAPAALAAGQLLAALLTVGEGREARRVALQYLRAQTPRYDKRQRQ